MQLPSQRIAQKIGGDEINFFGSHDDDIDILNCRASKILWRSTSVLPNLLCRVTEV